MKRIAYIVGSEARWLTETFPTDKRKIPYLLFVRLRAWLLRPFIQEYWTDANHLVPFLYKFNPNAKIRVVPDSIKYVTKYPKQYHKGFNVMYYYPHNEYNKTYCRWCYSKDILDQLVKLFPEFNWILVDGRQDMVNIFPYVDAYVRPNRHDGASRLVQECVIQEIPVMHTHCDPQIEDFVKFLTDQYKLKQE